MKKFISLSLITIMILAVTVLPSFAAEADEFTREEAEALLIEGYQRWTLIQEGIIPDSGKYLKEDHIEVDSDLQTRTLFETKGDGSAYKNSKTPENLDYVPVTDERFNTMEKCYEYVEQTFTDELAKQIITTNAYNYSYAGDTFESVRLSNGGKLYTEDYKSFDLWEDGKVMILYANKPAEPIQKLDEIGELTVNGNTAQMTVTMSLKELHNYNDVPNGAVDIFPKSDKQSGESVFWVPYTKTVSFTKTEEGWRISGGSFFEALMLEEEQLTVGMKRYLGMTTPSTGDNTLPTAVLLATAALAAIITPFALSKKRRVR